MPRKRLSSAHKEYIIENSNQDYPLSNIKTENLPVQRNAANARERARMRVLSSAFGRLKTKLPNIPPDTKLSKLDTLRLATIYIQQLKSVVDGCDASEENNLGMKNFNKYSEANNFPGNPQNMTWPFGVHHMQHYHKVHPHCNMDWSPSRDESDKNLSSEKNHEITSKNSNSFQYATMNTDIEMFSANLGSFNCSNNQNQQLDYF